MSNFKDDVVIVEALRTPIGAYMGSLKNINASELGRIVIKELINKSKISPNDVDEVILGQVLTSATGQNPARQSAINAGVPVSKPAHIVNQVCGSGMRAIISAYQSIKLGENNIIIAGGQENMSRSPHAIFFREDKELSSEKLIDTMTYDGLLDSFNGYHMGVTAENIAKKFNITREQQDLFSIDSQEKTQKAINEKKFNNEIVIIRNNKNEIILRQDEHPRKNINLTDLKNLKTVFKTNGTVTPGNSSGINDGASAIIIMSRKEAERRSLKPLARIISWASCGVEPSLMGLGPIPAVNLALKKASWKIDEVDLFELNEAFAAQSIAVVNELKIPKVKLNVNGGAIALGHPIGSSGSRIVVTLLHEMARNNFKKGLATLCIGGGMGIALCLERD